MNTKNRIYKDFVFKQFVVQQQLAAAKIGTDAVLLGAWTTANCQFMPAKALDVGSGTGVMALMLAQVWDKTMIDAVELDADSAQEAQINFNNSPWTERLQLISEDFFAFETQEIYDVIISNPPYHIELTLAAELRKAQAKQTAYFSPELFFEKSFRLLSQQGNMAIIFPFLHRKYYFDLAEKAGFTVEACCLVRGRNEADFKRCLVLFGKNSETLCRFSMLTIENKRHVYSEAYTKLTEAFYLKM